MPLLLDAKVVENEQQVTFINGYIHILTIIWLKLASG